MGMTMSQRILAYHANLETVSAGQLISAKVDMILGNDITTPVAINEFNKTGHSHVFDSSKIVIVLDHFTPNKDIKSAEQCKLVRAFAEQHSISNFFDVGEAGIEHVLLPEKGLVGPGSLVIGADSHTCTYGALGAFSTGIGSTDMAASMVTGKCWFKVPAAIKVILRGKPLKYVSGKDIILNLIGRLSVDGAAYKSIEFFGDGLKYLNIDDRFTIANMVIECGAKNGIFPVDEITKAYAEEHFKGAVKEFFPDDNAIYDKVIDIDLSKVKPTVAMPDLPDNIIEVEKLHESKIKLDQVVIGSCTNGRISDLRTAADILNKQQVSKGLRCIIIPGSQGIYLQALKEGLIEIFIKGGAIVSTPTCGPCLGGHMGVLAKDEVCLSTTNRNFVGRMGHSQSKIYLSNPAIAMASAIKGYITMPDNQGG